MSFCKRCSNNEISDGRFQGKESQSSSECLKVKLITILVISILGTLAAGFFLLNSSLKFVPSLPQLNGTAAYSLLAVSGLTALFSVAGLIYRSHKDQQKHRIDSSIQVNMDQKQNRGQDFLPKQIENMPWFLKQTLHKLKTFIDVNTENDRIKLAFKHIEATYKEEEHCANYSFNSTKFQDFVINEGNIESVLKNLNYFFLPDSEFKDLDIKELPQSSDDCFFDHFVVKGHLSGKSTEYSENLTSLEWSWLPIEALQKNLEEIVKVKDLEQITRMLFNPNLPKEILKKRLNSLSAEEINYFLPHLTKNQLLLLEDAHVLNKSFSWKQIKQENICYLFDRDRATFRLEKLGFELINENIVLFSFVLKFLPQNILSNPQLNLHLVDKYYLTPIFNVPNNPQKEVLIAAKEKIRCLTPENVNKIVSKLPIRCLALLSADYFQELKIENLTSEDINGLFEANDSFTDFGNKCELLDPQNIFLALGLEKTNKIIPSLSGLYLRELPPKFLQDENLDLTKIPLINLRSMFYTPKSCVSTLETEAITKCKKRIQLLPLKTLNDIIPNLDGEQLALLSKEQFATLDIREFKPTIKDSIIEANKKTSDLFEQSWKFSENGLSLSPCKIFRALGLEKTNAIIPSLRGSYLKKLPPEFLKDENLNLKDLTQPNLLSLFYVTEYRDSKEVIKEINNCKGRIQLLHSHTLNGIVSKLDGKRLALLSKEQFETLDIEELKPTIKNNRIVTNDKTFDLFLQGSKFSEAKLSLSPKEIFNALGFEKTNAIISSVSGLQLRELPDDFLKDKNLDLKNQSNRTLCSIFFIPSFKSNMSSNDLEMIDSCQNRLQMLPTNTLNVIAPKLLGKHLSLLSETQFKDLELNTLDTINLEDMFQAIAQLNKNNKGLDIQLIFKAIGIQGVNVLLDKNLYQMPLHELPDSFLESPELQLEKLSQDQLNRMFPYDEKKLGVTEETKRRLNLIPDGKNKLTNLSQNRKFLFNY